eukprot:Nk52_evm23s2085 gene=Nk52_evmTU23s2085
MSRNSQGSGSGARAFAISRQSPNTNLFLTLKGASSLVKQDLFRSPDPFAVISVDGRPLRNSKVQTKTLNPKFEQTFLLFVSETSLISISFFNHRKYKKSKGAGFMGQALIPVNVLPPLANINTDLSFKLRKQQGENTHDDVTSRIPSSGSTGSSGKSIVTGTVSVHLSASPANRTMRTASLPAVMPASTGSQAQVRVVQGDGGSDDDDYSVLGEVTSPPIGMVREEGEEEQTGRVTSPNHERVMGEDGRRRASPNRPAPSPPTQAGLGEAREEVSPLSTETRASTSTSNGLLSGLRRMSLDSRVSSLQGRNRSQSRGSAQGGLAGTPGGDSRSRRPSTNSLLRGSSSTQHVTPRQLAEINAVLPEGWEARAAPSGRAYFCNHITRKTQWERPTMPANMTCPSDDEEGAMDSGLMMRRGSRIASNSHQHNNSAALIGDGSGASYSASSAGAGPSSSSSRRQQRQAVRRQYESRGCLYPTGGSLPPGWERKVTALGQVYYLDHNTRTSTWHDPRQPRVLTSSRDLGPLPTGWEMRQNAQGRNYFVDHNTQTTQFADPRLQPPVPAEEDESVPQFQKDLKRKLGYIRSLLRAQPGQCDMVVRRQHIFEDSYKILNSLSADKLKRKLNIRFHKEEGLDYGGVSREWFYVLSHEMLNPYYGLFQYSRTDLYTLQINPGSYVNPDHLSYFMFVGRVIGMAVFHGYYIDGGFVMPFYKQMLGKPVGLEDMEFVDPEYYRSLKWVLENDVSELEAVFSVDHDTYGEIESKELKEGGANIPVTEENKEEYVNLVVQWRFRRGVSKQFTAFMKGFNDLIPMNLLSLFDEKELELVIGGLGEIDVDNWRKFTDYKHCKDTDEVVEWFWKAVASFDAEQKAKVLQFCTGTSRVPVNGFKDLQGSNGPRKFTIEVMSSVSGSKLPKSHTCFNRIDLPKYESFEQLREKLLKAVCETVGFGIE